MTTLKLLILRWLQQCCTHPAYAVKADILEGDCATSVQWCEVCGAHRIDWGESGWRMPRPDWYTPKQRQQYLDDLQKSL